MLEAVTSSLTTVIGWVGTTVKALTDAEGQLAALMPLLAVGVAISALMLGVKAIKSFAWGV